MHRARAVIAGAALIGAAATAVLLPVHADADPLSPTIVTLRAGEVTHAVAALERSHGFKAEHRYTSSLRGFSARLSSRQRSALRGDPLVAAVREDRPIALIAPVASVRRSDAPTGVRRIGGGTTAASVAVAVIDTGIDLRHPALNVETGVNCLSGKRRTSPAQDENGHGTHVAGTIGARAESGVAGVAPGTKLYAVKVMDERGVGSVSQVVCGIDWVTANAKRLGIAVANLSFGAVSASDRDCGETASDPLHEAICRSTESGITYVVAAGNDGSDLAGSVPAAYPEVLTVTAMTDTDGRAGGRGAPSACMPREHDDAPASFSNYATRAADSTHVVAAPGVCIRSTWIGGTTNTISGTSMASPHAAAAVALCISSGRCDRAPAKAIATVVADAARHAKSGFSGDADDAGSDRYYGFLVSAAP